MRHSWLCVAMILQCFFQVRGHQLYACHFHATEFVDHIWQEREQGQAPFQSRHADNEPFCKFCGVLFPTSLFPPASTPSSLLPPRHPPLPSYLHPLFPPTSTPPPPPPSSLLSPPPLPSYLHPLGPPTSTPLNPSYLHPPPTSTPSALLPPLPPPPPPP